MLYNNHDYNCNNISDEVNIKSTKSSTQSIFTSPHPKHYNGMHHVLQHLQYKYPQYSIINDDKQVNFKFILFNLSLFLFIIKLIFTYI